MSIEININEISDEKINEINENLIIEIENSKYNKFAPKKEVCSYAVENDNIYLPFSYAVNKLGYVRKDRKIFPIMDVKFEGILREEQIIVEKEALNLLSKNGCIMLSLSTGFGKTITSIELACKIKLKTLVIVNKIVLIKQWEEAIKKVCPEARIQKLKTESKFEDCDFYIMNAINVSKKGRKFFNQIGTVIVDEAHLIVAETLSKSLQYISPRYLLGLSATPYRTDGFDPLLNFYFGEEKIIRLLKRDHTVYKIKTGFTPKVQLAQNGKINWGQLLESQANDVNRNELIIKITKKFSDRNILILSKRVDQGEYIFSRLKEEGENVDSLIGSKQDFNKDARILVAIVSKAGTGFDHDKLDCLILATDLESYFIQALGRVLRRPDVKPLVFDLIDNNKILESHYRTRKSVYNEVGGKIHDFNKLYPDFFT